MIIKSKSSQHSSLLIYDHNNHPLDLITNLIPTIHPTINQTNRKQSITMANMLALPRVPKTPIASTRRTSDTGSTHSTVSTATTLKGSIKASKKWFSKAFDPKYTIKSDVHFVKQANHNEAVASYFSLR